MRHLIFMVLPYINSDGKYIIIYVYAILICCMFGTIQVLRTQQGVGGYQIFLKKALRRCTVQRYYRYKGVGGWVSNFQKKNPYVTLEWPLT